ncbi:hypothetical protein Lal_00040091 [Lupinus albus]|nr:hypothetical protein Lal_00040091 [Lupinus albus]
MIASQLPTPTSCTWCNARLFHHETETICCLRTKVWLQQINAHQRLLDLIVDSSYEGRHFRQHITSYNHIFAFTSLGVHLDNRLAATRRDIYIFRAQGSTYHKIGGLLLNEGDRPYRELQNRMLENPQLHENVVSKILSGSLTWAREASLEQELARLGEGECVDTEGFSLLERERQCLKI